MEKINPNEQTKGKQKESILKALLPYVVGIIGGFCLVMTMVMIYIKVNEPLFNQPSEVLSEVVEEIKKEEPLIDKQLVTFPSLLKQQESISTYLTEVDLKKKETISSIELVMVPNEAFHSLSLNEKKDLVLEIQTFIKENWMVDSTNEQSDKISSVVLYSEEEKYGYQFAPTGFTLTHLFTDENDRNQSEKLDLQSKTETSTNHAFNDSGSLYIEGSGSIALEEESITFEGEYIAKKGFVVNNTNKTIYFVPINFEYYNKENELIEVDWTYGVGSEGLEPGRRKAFKNSVKFDSQIDFITIYSYIDSYKN